MSIYDTLKNRWYNISLFPNVGISSTSLSKRGLNPVSLSANINSKGSFFFEGTFYKPNNFGILIKGIDISNYYTAPYRYYTGGSKPYNYTVNIPTNVKQLKVVVIGNGGGD